MIRAVTHALASSRGRLAALAGALAAAGALLFMPACLWGTPAVDLQQEGFDPALIAAQPSSAIARDPLAFIDAATGLPCPCAPGARITAIGDLYWLAQSKRVTLLVDGSPVTASSVSPSQLSFTLPASVGPAAAPIVIEADNGASISDVLPVGASDGKAVLLARDHVTVQARGGADPAVHLLTTPLPFVAEMTVTVQEAQGDADPAWLALWDARSGALAAIAVRASGSLEAIVMDGPALAQQAMPLGRWLPASPVRLRIERGADGSTLLHVATLGQASSVRIDARDIPLLSRAFRPSLSLISVSRHGSATVAASDWRVTLPHRAFITDRTTATGGRLGLALSVLAITAIAAALWRSRGLQGQCAPRRPLLSLVPISAGGALVATAGVLPTWALLAGRAPHPFDMSAQAIWTYILSSKGLGDIYHLSQVVPITAPWGGTPFHEAVFPYGPTMAYWFRLIGAILSSLPRGALPSESVTVWGITAANALAAVICGALAAALTSLLNPRSRLLPLAAAAAVAVSPAALADGALWGETEHVVLTPVLASVLAMATGHIGIAWALLAVAALSKQTILPIALLLSVMYAVSSPSIATLRGLAAAGATALALALPFMAHGYPPQVALQPLWHTTMQHAWADTERAFQTMALDLPNLWTLLVHPLAQARGLSRLSYPDYVPLIGGMSAHTAGTILSGALFTTTLLLLVLSGRRRDLCLWLLAMSFVWAGGLLLATGSLSRYLLLPAVTATVVAAARPRLWTALPCILLHGITAFTIAGSLLLAIHRIPGGTLPLLPGATLLMNAYASDAAITATAFALAAAVLLLAVALVASWWSGRAASAPLPQHPARNALFAGL